MKDGRENLKYLDSNGLHGMARRAALLQGPQLRLGCRRSFSAFPRRNIRLINVETLKLEEFYEKPPRYAILSHTWGNSEVSFQEWLRNEPDTQKKHGYQKIGGACAEAAKFGYKYLWCDTNCIDKTSSAELSEAINSMFSWYKNSAVCFAYLADVRPLSPGFVAAVLNSEDYRRLAQQKYERMAAKIRDIVGENLPIFKPPSMESSTSDISVTSSLVDSDARAASWFEPVAPERRQDYQKRAQQYERMAIRLRDLGEPYPSLESLSKESRAKLTGYENLRATIGSDIQALKTSRWFTRGWTLQELLAPQNLMFYAEDWSVIGNKQVLSSVLSHLTGIDESCIKGEKDTSQFSIAQRMAWASKRSTTRIEDMAYSLLGIFGISMPLLYGEGPKAFKRLQEEIIRVSSDQSILAWAALPEPNSYDSAADIVPYLASHPRAFDATLIPFSTTRLESERSGSWTSLPAAPFSITNMGLSIQLPLLRTFDPNLVLAGLNYVLGSDTKYQIWLPLLRVGTGKNHLQRPKVCRSGFLLPLGNDIHQSLESILITDDTSRATGIDLIDLSDRHIPKISYMIMYGKSHPTHYLSDVAGSHGCFWMNQYSLLLTGNNNDRPGQRESAVLVFSPTTTAPGNTKAFAIVLWATHFEQGVFSNVGGIVVTNLPQPCEELASIILQEAEISPQLTELAPGPADLRSIPWQSLYQIQAQEEYLQAFHRIDQQGCDGYPKVTLGQQVKWGWKMRNFKYFNSAWRYANGVVREQIRSDPHDEENQCLIPVRLDFAEDQSSNMS